MAPIEILGLSIVGLVKRAAVAPPGEGKARLLAAARMHLDQYAFLTSGAIRENAALRHMTPEQFLEADAEWRRFNDDIKMAYAAIEGVEQGRLTLPS
jgi:hypothetical protein